MFSKIGEKILTRSALRVILSLIIGLAAGLKMPELGSIACKVAEVLEIAITNGCS
jgi:hypothetical protein